MKNKKRQPVRKVKDVKNKNNDFIRLLELMRLKNINKSKKKR